MTEETVVSVKSTWDFHKVLLDRGRLQLYHFFLGKSNASNKNKLNALPECSCVPSVSPSVVVPL